MPALVLLYHRTPTHAVADQFDVPLQIFREQIERLCDAGVRFVPFSAVREASRSENLSVCITLDDGHSSNERAFEYLATKRITPASFIVRDWAKTNPAYMSAASIARWAGLVEFGGHGTTHRKLTTLSDAELRDELTGSRQYLEDLLGQGVDSMAFPFGECDARVLRLAAAAGFRLAANTVEDLNYAARFSVNRVGVRGEHSPSYSLDLLHVPRSFWLRQRLIRATRTAARRALGEDGYARAKSLARILHVRH